MYFSTLPLSILLSLLPSFLVVNAQGHDNWASNSFLQQYLTFLNGSGYTSLSNALLNANSTDSGQKWLSQLSEGNWTVFVPTNDALSSVPDSVSGNTTLLVEYLSYHFVHGSLYNTTGNSSGGAGGSGQTSSSTISSSASSGSSIGGGSESTTAGSTVTTAQPSAYRLIWRSRHPHHSETPTGPQLLSGVYPNVTIGRTLLNASDLVHLEGNKSQVLAWTRSGEQGNVTILNQINNVTVANATQWCNFFVVQIDGVLTPPGDVSVALAAIPDQPLLDLANQLQVPLSNGTNGTAVEALSGAQGFTLFAPSAEAFSSANDSSAIQQLQGNQTAILALLQNHFVNGSTIYSPRLMELGANVSSNSSQTIYTAAGEPLTVTFNATGTFVSNGNGTTAQITRPDVLVENGVIHVIDRVLVNTASEPSAASSAYASATSVAAQTSTDTSILGILPIPAPTSGGGQGGGSSMSSSAGGGGESSSTSSSVTQSSTSGGSESTSAGATATPSSFRVRHVLNL